MPDNLRLKSAKDAAAMSDNVPSSTAERKPAKKSAKVNRVLACEQILAQMRLEGGDGAHWPGVYKVYEPAGGARMPIVVKDGEASLVSVESVAAEVMAYTRRLAATLPEGGDFWRFDADDCIKGARYWLMAAQPLKHIPMVAWLDELETVAWRQLPWRRGETAPTPTWDRLLDGMTNARAFKLWLASCFIETADVSTYCWLHGQGANGKSRIMAFLARAFGPAFVGTDEKSAQSKHWSAALIGRRVVAFPDTNTRTMTTSGRFKAITGGDAVMIEPKYKDAFAVKLPVRFIMSSNNVPELSSGAADLRRCIFVEMQPIPEGDRRPIAEVDEALWREGGAFVTHCLELYREHCPGDCAIPFDAEGTAGLAADAEADFSLVVDSYLVTGSPTYRMAGHELVGLLKGLWGRNTDNRTISDFVAYLERNLDIKKVVSKGRRHYVGMALNFEGKMMAAGRPFGAGYPAHPPSPPKEEGLPFG